MKYIAILAIASSIVALIYLCGSSCDRCPYNVLEDEFDEYYDCALRDPRNRRKGRERLITPPCERINYKPFVAIILIAVAILAITP